MKMQMHIHALGHAPGRDRLTWNKSSGDRNECDEANKNQRNATHAHKCRDIEATRAQHKSTVAGRYNSSTSHHYTRATEQEANMKQKCGFPWGFGRMQSECGEIITTTV